MSDEAEIILIFGGLKVLKAFLINFSETFNHIKNSSFLLLFSFITK